MMDNESFEEAIAPKRKRTSILRPPEKRASRDSRTVSFDDRWLGTCILNEDMEITQLDIDNAEPIAASEYSMGSQFMDITLEQSSPPHQQNKLSQSYHASQMHNVSQTTPPKQSQPQIQQQQEQQHETTIHRVSQQHQVTQTTPQLMQITQHEISQQQQKLPRQRSISPEKTMASMTQMSDISSLNVSELTTRFANDTLYGAFHESNNLSIQSSRTSGVDTLMHNIEALNDCIHKVDQESEECIRRLDAEMENLFKFYRHIVNNDDKYEFAIAIFGLRHSLWLIIKVNPDTYPNEKLKLRFAVNKKDRHLYPFADFSEAVRRCTKEGNYGYLTKFVINAQRFRRFLRKIGYRKGN